MDEQAGLENRSPSRDRGFESHPLRHSTKSHQTKSGATLPSRVGERGGVRTGVLKGVSPLHGVTGATRRREGAWPPGGSPERILWATSNTHPLRSRTPVREDLELPYCLD